VIQVQLLPSARLARGWQRQQQQQGNIRCQ